MHLQNFGVFGLENKNQQGWDIQHFCEAWHQITFTFRRYK